VLLALVALAACDDMSAQNKRGAYSGNIDRPGGTEPFNATPGPPPRLSIALLQRGQQRFRINCVPCHSELGDGNGMVVRRGFPQPPSYHIDRLRSAPPQYIVDVITNGHGAMYSFAQRVKPADRWAIAAYVKALQLSQDASPDDVPAEQRQALR
jgi:mono/diheme cytochrome c family protein